MDNDRHYPSPATKGLLGSWLSRRIERYRRSKFKKRDIHLLTPEERFTWIYKNNYWSSSESVSGSGSTLDQTTKLRAFLPELIKYYGIKSVLDVPCGDFNWMRYALKDLDVTYLGGDIVKDLIIDLQGRYSLPNVQFRHIDLTSDPLPSADLLICRDCLFHLSFDDIQRALENLAKSEIRYILTTTHGRDVRNSDIATGHFRHINLLDAPFNFPEPLRCVEDYVAPAAYREMCLWRVNQLVGSIGDLPKQFRTLKHSS